MKCPICNGKIYETQLLSNDIGSFCLYPYYENKYKGYCSTCNSKYIWVEYLSCGTHSIGEIRKVE